MTRTCFLLAGGWADDDRGVWPWARGADGVTDRGAGGVTNRGANGGADGVTDRSTRVVARSPAALIAKRVARARPHAICIGHAWEQRAIVGLCKTAPAKHGSTFL